VTEPVRHGDPVGQDKPAKQQPPIPLVVVPKDLSEVVLVLANAGPLLGVVFMGWDVFDVLFLYWLESAIIGFYSALKAVVSSYGLAILLLPFFFLHFGLFMCGHVTLLFHLFGREAVGIGPFYPWELVVWPPLLDALDIVWWPAVGLFASHGASFLLNFLAQGEYRRASGGELLDQPYRRIAVMQVTLILTGWIHLAIGAPFVGLVILLVLKTLVDLRAHRREHVVPAAG
jgi:hypothetical protein